MYVSLCLSHLLSYISFSLIITLSIFPVLYISLFCPRGPEVIDHVSVPKMAAPQPTGRHPILEPILLSAAWQLVYWLITQDKQQRKRQIGHRLSSCCSNVVIANIPAAARVAAHCPATAHVAPNYPAAAYLTANYPCS